VCACVLLAASRRQGGPHQPPAARTRAGEGRGSERVRKPWICVWVGAGARVRAEQHAAGAARPPGSMGTISGYRLSLHADLSEEARDAETHAAPAVKLSRVAHVGAHWPLERDLAAVRRLVARADVCLVACIGRSHFSAPCAPRGTGHTRARRDTRSALHPCTPLVSHTGRVRAGPHPTAHGLRPSLANTPPQVLTASFCLVFAILKRYSTPTYTVFSWFFFCELVMTPDPRPCELFDLGARQRPRT